MKIPLKNWAISIAIKKFLCQSSKTEPIPWTKFYSNMPTSNMEALNYVKQKSEKRKKIVDAILKNTSKNGKILEAGCGTSALSIWLSLLGLQSYALDFDEKMLILATRLNTLAQASVTYQQGDLFNIPYPSSHFEVIFSHGVLEHFKMKDIPKAINEGLRVANTYIFSIPTIFDVSNGLRGDEYLLTFWHWKNAVKKSNGYISNVLGSFPYHPRLEKLNNRLKEKLSAIVPVLILEVKRKS